MKNPFTDLLKTLRRNLFFRQHPGPFGCFEGSEGVDNTIDVVCLNSDTRIATYRYWECKQEAIDRVTLVAESLNRLAGFADFVEKRHSNRFNFFDLSKLAQQERQEFTASLEHCPYCGPQWLVQDKEDRTIIECTDWDLGTQPKQTANVIANALNLQQVRKRREA